MAKVIKKDSDTLVKAKDSFLRDLQQFHESRGTPCRYTPKIAGKEIDLYLLYTLVTNQGGWVKVNSRNQWNNLLKEFDLPKNCVNVSVALKQIYLRYLDKYEKAHFLGETHNAVEDDDDSIIMTGRHKRWSTVRSVQQTVPLTYNHNQHHVTSSTRLISGLSTNLYDSSEYDKLALSLLSPLPNEQDFAINVCTLLSNEFRATGGQPTGIKISKHPRILRYLLAHAGVFADETLRTYFTNNYKEVRHKSLETFWDDVVYDKKILKMMREMIEDECNLDRKYILQIREKEEREKLRKKERGIDDESDDEIEELNNKIKINIKIKREDKTFFNLGRLIGTKEYIGQRILQIATVLRNFTFNDENNLLLSHDLTFLRFMILCCSSNWSCLRQLGLDMFSNIAHELTLDEQLAPVLFEIISNGLECEDRASILACIEILNKLGQVEKNEDILIRSLQQKVYNQVCTLLTLHDIMLLIHTLECLYSLSSLGERSCNSIIRVHGAMDVLVALVTVEAQSFGPKACILMRVVETVAQDQSDSIDDSSASSSSKTFTSLTNSTASSLPPPKNITPTFSVPMALAPVAVAVPVPISVVQSQSPISTSPMITSSPVPQNVTSSTMSMTPRPRQIVSNLVNSSNIIRPIRNVTPSSSIPTSSPSPVIQSTSSNNVFVRTSTPGTFRVITPNRMAMNNNVNNNNNTSNTTTATPIVRSEENGEMFATQWLRSNFEHATLPGRAIEQAELYKQYINAASRAGRKGVIAPLHFPRVVRSVFGAQIGPKQVIPAPTPGSQGPPPPPIHVYEGIQVRGKQPIITQTIAIASSPQNPPQSQESLHQQQQQARCKTPVMTQQQAMSMQPNTTPNPMSPILKAQLSAPPKPQSQVSASATCSTATTSNTARTKAHPHLSQALLGAGGGNNPAPLPNSSNTTPSNVVNDQSQAANTSLIKSLLATKVGPENGHPPNITMITPLVVNTAVAAQVTQRQQQQQKMLHQQNVIPTSIAATANSSTSALPTSIIKNSGETTGGGVINPSTTTPATTKPALNQLRLNGMCVNVQQVTNHIIENSLDSKSSLLTESVGTNTAAILPSQSNYSDTSSQPPPLAPLSSNQQQPNTTVVPNIKQQHQQQQQQQHNKVDAECNTTLTLDGNQIQQQQQTVVATAGAALDGTSVVVNGGMSNSINPTTLVNDKDVLHRQSLMLVDLLEKSINDKDPTALNGAVRIGEKGLDLFTSIDNKNKSVTSVNSGVGGQQTLHTTVNSGVIRRVSTELEAANNILNNSAANGTTIIVNQNGVPITTTGAGEKKIIHHVTAPGTTTCGAVGGLKRIHPNNEDKSGQPVPKKIHMNGDINMTEEETIPEENNVKASSTAANLYAALAADVLEDEEIPDPQQQLQQSQTPSTPQPHQVAVQTQQQQQSQPIFVATGSGGQPRQILVTGGATGGVPQRVSMMGQHYVVTQQPNLMQGGHSQTVLVAQSNQPGGSSQKTIFILQPQSSGASSQQNTSNKSIVSSIAGSSTITTNTNQKVIVSVPGTSQTSVLHRTPIRPQQGGTMIIQQQNQSNSTVIKQVVNDDVRGIMARPSRPQNQHVFQQSPQQQQYQNQQQKQNQPQQQQNQQIVRIQQQQQQQQQQIQIPAGHFLCEWRGCMRNFKSANEVYMHATESHCPNTPLEIQCLWERCDAMKRKRFSHMTHLYDRHCNPDVLRAMAARRKQLSQSGKTEIPVQSAPTPHPGYAPNAAFNAIKRHALEFVNPKELQDDNEGPVTKSIRLTSSLILRNLVIYSPMGKRHLVSYEPHLANVALSNVESSKTIAQVLFDLNNTQSR